MKKKNKNLVFTYSPTGEFVTSKSNFSSFNQSSTATNLKKFNQN